MLAFALQGQIGYAQDGTDFKKECLLTTEEYGAADRTDGVTM